MDRDIKSRGLSKLRVKILGGLAAAGLMALSGTSYSAGVNVNNLNFFVANTDFYLPTSGLNFEISRTYSSRSSYVKGSFGVGWSSELEGRIEVKEDAISFYEGGGGNIVRFAPQKGGTWSNSLYGLQSISHNKKSGVYTLKSALGKFYTFDKSGKMTSIADTNGNRIVVHYKDGLIDYLQDNLNNQVKFSWDTFGKHPRITRIERDNLKAQYKYDNFGNLKEVVDVEAVPYRYTYDDEHNMTRITYANGEYKAMKYNKARDWIRQFRDRDGLTTDYDYFADSLDPENKFGTIVARYQEGSKDKSYSKFWYEFRKRADGGRYNYRSVTSINNVVTETLFTDCCGTPLVVSQWQDTSSGTSIADKKKLDWTIAKGPKTSTSFQYYEDGLLKTKTAPNGIVTALTYHPEHKKVASVQTGPRKISYGYDKKGNLVSAFDHQENRRLNMSYDLKGRIEIVKETVGKNSKQVFFRYDGQGRPIEIKEKSKLGSGSIQMQYGPNGEVQSVLNSKGRAIASEQDMATAQGVFITFQNLLEIVQPAGVTLGPEG